MSGVKRKSSASKRNPGVSERMPYLFDCRIRKYPLQVKVNATNSARLHWDLKVALPHISLFSRAWFLFVFENYWYDEVKSQLISIDRRVADENLIMCPAKKHIWRWAELIPDPTDVRVVIVGQDPYTQISEDGTPMADGLAFSVSQEYRCRVNNQNRRLPPSLVNVLNAVRKTTECTASKKGHKTTVSEGNLEDWCRQGVLLLNNVLTAPGDGGCANSHHDFGWQFVTDAVIRRLGNSEMPHRVFFMLWGQESKLSMISRGGTAHRVFTSHHPSNRQGEFDHEQFVLCNQLLVKDGRTPIRWWIH